MGLGMSVELHSEERFNGVIAIDESSIRIAAKVRIPCALALAQPSGTSRKVENLK